ncbi:hypothetical protein CEE39_07500 [bacterium (candidate division B38) B3_B38]|nr:MAG: hypothetical protein CEE39_07500 [bacterium (candidate division B38) B3_B38]
MALAREDELFYTSLESSIGCHYMALTGKGVCFLSLNRSEEEFLQELKDSGIKTLRRDDLKGGFVKRELEGYFARELRHFQTPIDLLWGTTFERRVWQELSRIPYGETRSYQEVAESVGVPRGYRAVGRAVGKNPIGIIIPCHRVILSDGGLGGFGAGLEAKRYLLNLEGHPISP